MLSSTQLNAIEQEVRQCFIQEDAPEYLQDLEQGVLVLLDPQATTPGEDTVWQAVLRAAHTLKGGAGLAHLYHLSHLAHQLEDLLIALRERQIQAVAEAHRLLLQGLDEIRLLLIRATQGEADPASRLQAPLDEFLQLVQAEATQAETDEVAAGQTANPEPLGMGPVRIVLETDFNQRLEEAAEQFSTRPVADFGAIAAELAEHCQALGEILSLGWLQTCASQIQQRLRQPEPLALEQVLHLLTYLQTTKEQTLQGQRPAGFKWAAAPTPAAVSVADQETSPAPDAVQAEAPVSEASVSEVPVSEVPVSEIPVSATKSTPVEPTTMRVSVQRLDRLADAVGEMFITYEGLSLEQQRLLDSNRTLKRWTRQFYQVREQIQTLYDGLLLPLQTGQPGSSRVLPSALGEPKGDFDPLEMDRFTELHSVLQDFQELLTRIEEGIQDIELLGQTTQEAMNVLRQHMGTLRVGLMEARLVPFKLLADRFRRPVSTLSQRFGKQVDLQIQGGDTPIDRAILEHLYEPMLHLIRNAFDHGMETPEERLALGKPEQGTIALCARHEGTQVSLQIQDDGQGIDWARVTQKALAQGLLTNPNASEDTLSQILFSPGFSTAQQVGELSGRGVGLDVVQAQVEKLSGHIAIQTRAGVGTTFTLSVPLSLNILPMLLCLSRRGQGLPALLAVPVTQVIDIIDLAHWETPQPQLEWMGQSLSCLLLQNLLALQGSAAELTTAIQGAQDITLFNTTQSRRVGLIVAVGDQIVSLVVDQLLGERELVLKAFSQGIPVPSYLSGCTILPTGQAVPVLWPEGLAAVLALQVNRPAPSRSVTTSQPRPTTSTLRLLVADDSLTARRWLVRSLEQLGYEVLQCRDGQDAWEQLQKGISYDLVVSDVEMPRMDGFQLLKEIRQHPHLQHLPVALLTSRQGDRHIQTAVDLGANGYYTKPLGNQQLLQDLPNLVKGEKCLPGALPVR